MPDVGLNTQGQGQNFNINTEQTTTTQTTATQNAAVQAQIKDVAEASTSTRTTTVVAAEADAPVLAPPTTTSSSPAPTTAENSSGTTTLATGRNDANAQYNAEYDSAIDRVMDMLLAVEDSPYTSDEIAKMTFALKHPDLADSATLKKLQDANVQELLKGELAKITDPPPEGWTPNSQNLDEAISQTYTAAFEAELAKQQTAQGLSSDQVAKLRMLFYHPDADVEGKQELLAMLTSMKSAALNSIREATGIPEGLQPSTSWQPMTSFGAEVFDSSVNVEFQATNERNLSAAIASASPPLTANEQTQLRQAISDPNANVTPEIRKMAQEILDQSTSALKSKYGLPDTWIPPTGPTLWAGSPAVLSSIQTLQDMNAIVDQTIAENPNMSPAMVSTMQAIKTAIQDLMTILNDAEGKKAAGQKSLSAASCETALARIAEREKEYEEQVQKQKEAEEKAKKSGDIGLVMKIIMPIVVAITIVVASVFLGPAALAILIVLSAVSMTATYGGPNIMQMAIQGISQGLNYIPGINKLGEHGLNIISTVLMVMVIVAVVVAAPGSAPGLLSAGLQAFMVGSMAIQASGVGEDIMLEADPNMDPSKAALYGAIIGGGIAIIGSFAMAYGALAKSALQATQTTLKTVMAWLKTASAVIQLAQASAGAAKGYVDYKYYNLQGDIAVISQKIRKGDILNEDQIESIRLLIKQLQDKLQELIDTLKGASESVSQTNKSFQVQIAV
jgi:hypothetical protein